MLEKPAAPLIITAMKTKRWQPIAQGTALVVLAVVMLPFAFYAVDFGWAGLLNDLAEPHYIFSEDLFPNAAIAVHMGAGAAITILVPFQLIGPLRRRLPWLHRWAGRIIVFSGIVAATGGLAYIAVKGTIGGTPMNIGFTLYGLLILLAAAQTYLHARARNIAAHNAWALRLFWLALGSWLYRVHYGLWYLATDGRWSNPDFTGAFDLVQNVAFYLPYLIGVEIYLARKRYRVAVN